MTLDLNSLPKIVRLQLRIRQYPILGKKIRDKMLKELFNRGIITPNQMDQEVVEKSIESQQLDGQNKSRKKEPDEVWKLRTNHVRDYLTEFYFAYNLPMTAFDTIINELVDNQDKPTSNVSGINYNPEMAPLDLLMSHGEQIEALEKQERQVFEHHLQEIKVVAIKTILSDRLEFIGTAKNWFKISDLFHILNRRYGTGKIGGKAAGIELAKIMMQSHDSPTRDVRTPLSYFIATDVFEQFKDINNLSWVMNQKYRSPEEINKLFPKIKRDFSQGNLPNTIQNELKQLLIKHHKQPIIVRSSSLLEDSYGTSFAGKYDSYFCGNQAETDDNLYELSQAISKIYASVYSPDALIYRKKMGLLDYDERMAILIQVVDGEQYGDYFYPPIAGVAFSKNQYRWTPRIDPDQGLVRLVYGLGTRAVNQTTDYARMIAMSHPNIRPESNTNSIIHYSQKKIDLINLKSNKFQTKLISSSLNGNLKWLRLIAEKKTDNYLSNIIVNNPGIESDSLVLTFTELIKRTDFTTKMKKMLQYLSTHYGSPVDVEFTAKIEYEYDKPQISLCLVQCRPQSLRITNNPPKIPSYIDKSSVIFKSKGIVRDAHIKNIKWIVYIPIKQYDTMSSYSSKTNLARVIGRINHILQDENFILIGPYRWGSNNPDLGVKVTYADVHNSKMLIEVMPETKAKSTEPSYGTHFFQDLVEANIYTLAINLKAEGSFISDSLSSNYTNMLSIICPEDSRFNDQIKIYNIAEHNKHHTLNVIMVSETEQSIGFINTNN
tara:strand:+ start:7758 stop:10079 length:2322 start_codon:yes stop_codon:yes gene_type:complete